MSRGPDTATSAPEALGHGLPPAGGRKCLSSAVRAGDQLQPVLGPQSRWGDPRPEPRLTRAHNPGVQSEEAAGCRTLRLHEAGGSGPGRGRASRRADVAGRAAGPAQQLRLGRLWLKRRCQP